MGKFPWERAEETMKKEGVALLVYPDDGPVEILLKDYVKIEEYGVHYPLAYDVEVSILISKDIARKLLEKLKKAKEAGAI